MISPYRAMCALLLEALEIQLDELRFNNRLCIRARALLAQPEPPELTDEKLLSLVAEVFGYVFLDGGIGGGESEFLAYARAAIAADRARALMAQPKPPELTDAYLISAHDLAAGWNQQADAYNQWDSLDLDEQLAWAQSRAIAADRARYGRPTPQPEPAPVAESPADGEVAELVARLKAIRNDYGVWHSADCQRAAALLEALPTPEALDD
jgi:hypothetical protein